jgi:sec-independent protein translocase protein TatB
MFDIGFSELMVIAVVALIVIGPERLPKVARTVGLLFGRMQRYVNDVKADINREMALDELRKLQANIQDTANSLEQSMKQEVGAVESDLNKIASDTQAAVAPEASPAETAEALAAAEAMPPAETAATAATAGEVKKS